MIKASQANTELNMEKNFKLYQTNFYKLDDEKKIEVNKKSICEEKRICIESKNFSDLVNRIQSNQKFFGEKVISFTFHLSEPENFIKLNSLTFSRSMKNLVMLFNGFPILDNFEFLYSLDLNVFTVNLNYQGFQQFWDQMTETTRIKTLNIYLHLTSFSEFNLLFMGENEGIKKFYNKVYDTSRARNLECLNLNIIFESKSVNEEFRIKEELNLKQLILCENKYYFGFLKIFSMNLIINPNKDFFLFSGLNKNFNQPTKFMLTDKSLETSFKLCSNNDTSVLYALKKKHFGNYVLQNVFKFLAKKEYTVVNFSKAYYIS